MTNPRAPRGQSTSDRDRQLEVEVEGGDVHHHHYYPETRPEPSNRRRGRGNREWSASVDAPSRGGCGGYAPSAYDGDPDDILTLCCCGYMNCSRDDVCTYHKVPRRNLAHFMSTTVHSGRGSNPRLGQIDFIKLLAVFGTGALLLRMFTA